MLTDWVCCTLPGELFRSSVFSRLLIFTMLINHRPNNNVVLDPIDNSPLLKRLGLTTNVFTELGQHLTTEQWVKVRQTQQQRPTSGAKITDGKYEHSKKDLEILPGLHAKIHN